MSGRAKKDNIKWTIDPGTIDWDAIDKQKMAIILSKCKPWRGTMEPIKDESIQVEITVPDKDDQELLIKALRTGEPIVATINRGTEHEFSVLVTIDSAEPV